MKTILCYGDSNLWGFIPGSYNNVTGLAKRYLKRQRWTGILQNNLGESYIVIEEGMNGRTTTLDEITPGRPYRNGLTYLPFCLESHYPIDLVILLLGTNDLKKQYNRPITAIAEGIRELITCIKISAKGSLPNVLVIAPPLVIKIPNLHEQFDDTAIDKSTKLARAYESIAREEGCGFLDAAQIVTASNLDGIHLDENQCKLLGETIVEKVKQQFK